jgi:hypothetical protein
MDTQVIRLGVKCIFRTEDIKHKWTGHTQKMHGARYVLPITTTTTTTTTKRGKKGVSSTETDSAVTKVFP